MLHSKKFKTGVTGFPVLPVLCVDDNISFLNLLKHALELSGFDVITASHGMDALMQYQAHEGHFSTIVTDSDMPYMKGEALIATVRRLGFRGRVIVMSGNLSPEIIPAFDALKISDYLQKPFPICKLAEMLKQEKSA